MVAPVSVIFTSKKLKTFLPSLKDKIVDSLYSMVVDEITCPGCPARYVGQTTRHLITRLTEHPGISSPFGQHISESCMGKVTQSARIIDKLQLPVEKLLTLEALHISQRNSALNQREKYRKQ